MSTLFLSGLAVILTLFYIFAKENEMTEFFLITILVLFCLIAILILIICVQSKVHKTKLKNLESEYKENQNEENKRVSEVLNNANNQKDSIHADNSTSFNNSLNILQKYAKGSKRSADSD